MLSIYYRSVLNRMVQSFCINIRDQYFIPLLCMPYYMVDLMEPVTVKDHENSVAAGAVVE